MERVRFGGEVRDGRFVFERSGGDLALDFINTLDERGRKPIERLRGYSDITAWALQAGCLDVAEAQAFERLSNAQPSRTDHAVTEVIAFRETAFEILWALSQRRTPSPSAMADFERWREGASMEVALIVGMDGLGWARPNPDRGLLQVVWPVVRAAVALAIDRDAVGRLRCCAGEGCEWLFLDRSPRQSRRWCDMSVCGNRAKVKAFRRNRADAGRPPTGK